MRYKSLRIIDGKPKWVITDEYEYIVNKDPTKEELKFATILAIDGRKRLKINVPLEERECCICKSTNTYIDNSGRRRWYVCGCNKNGCTGLLCDRCFHKGRYIADWRIRNLDPSSPSGRGFIGQQIVAKTYGVEDCNLKMDNFCFYIDLSKIMKFGYCEVKTSSFNRLDERWHFNTKRGQEYNNIILICMDENWPWKNVERVYIIPWEAVGYRTNISLYKNPSRKVWYEEFEIDKKPFNETYHSMKLENCNVLRKR